MVNGTCETRPGGSCFSSVEEVLDESTNEFEPERTYGCMGPEQSGGLLQVKKKQLLFMNIFLKNVFFFVCFQCKVATVPHLHGKNIYCCDSEDFCNKDLHPKYVPRTTTPAPHQAIDNSTIMALMISIIVSGIIFLIFILTVYVIYKRREKNGRQACPRACLIDSMRGSHTSQLADLVELSSGSGSGLPLLVQRTIAKEIEFTQLIGQGRFGKVYLAKFRGENVAAKVFNPAAEASWFRESEIYQSVVMRHENIMGFIAADIDGSGQRTLITHYHEMGSLHDYLRTHVLSPMKLFDLAHSLASGLAHLHTEIFGSSGKPAIAHGDINSKNILVKKDLKCAISDFGLAVKYLSDVDEIQLAPSGRVASYRYMAPEILNKTMVTDKFESYKMADMYAAGLVYWEMSRCCTTMINGTKKSTCDGYALPYHDVLPFEPKMEDMRKVVCGDGIRDSIRPPVPTRWDEDEVLRCLKGVMIDCWKENPSSRLTALRVKKSLGKLQGNPDEFLKMDTIRLV